MVKAFRREQSGRLPIYNLDSSSKHFYRWHICNYLLLFNYICISNLTAQFWTAHTWAQSCSIVSHLFKNYPLNRTLIHGAREKLDCWIARSAEMKAKIGWEITVRNCKLNAFLISEDICCCLYYHISCVLILCWRFIDSLHCAGEQEASNTFIQQDCQ